MAKAGVVSAARAIVLLVSYFIPRIGQNHRAGAVVLFSARCWRSSIATTRLDKPQSAV